MAVGDAELQDLYRDVLIDYYRDGTFKGTVTDHDIHSHGVNPVCGDEIEVALKAPEGSVSEIRFSGHGCVISQASAAMMCEAIEGKTLAEVRRLVDSFKSFMLDKTDPGWLPEDLDEVKALDGVRNFPLRIKCALLAWNTLLQGLDEKDAGHEDAEYQETPMCDTKDAETPKPPAESKTPSGTEVTFKQIGAAVEPVEDPEIHISVAELGLIYGAEVEDADEGGKKVKLTMSLTSPACPYGPMLLASVHGALAKIPGVRDVDVDLSFSPVWDPKKFASEEAKDELGIF